MNPEPVSIRPDYKGADKLKGKVALITGGDSGIGRAVALHFAREGADVAIVYLEESEDAETTKKLVEKEGRKCLTLAGDVGDPQFCARAVRETVSQFGKLNILVNNAAEQHPREDLEEVSADRLEQTFRTNLFGYFHMAREAHAHLGEGDCVINTTSVTAYRGHGSLVDYASTKGAITAFTRSLAQMWAPQGIRVNAVAPGPIWTPLIPATFPADKVESFGADTLLKRAGQPCEVATCYVFLASSDGSYMVGQTLHPNGGGFIHT